MTIQAGPHTLVIIGYVIPCCGGVAGLATAGVVRCRHIAFVADGAGGQATVVEAHIFPVAGGVAGGALPAVVIALAVAGGAVG